MKRAAAIETAVPGTHAPRDFSPTHPIGLRAQTSTDQEAMAVGSHGVRTMERNGSHAVVNALTVDVEDYYQVSAFEHRVPRHTWDQFPSRVEANTERLLSILDRCQVRATFFVVGWIAERHPRLVQQIAQLGHEVASHSHWHRLVYRLAPDHFREDLRRARQVLEDATGQPVMAFRAPSFSITRQSLWALDILVEEGFECDSSIFPIAHDRYGMPGAPVGIHRRQTLAGPIVEVPPTVWQWGALRLPAGGGGYFRLLPDRIFRWMIRDVISSGRPAVFYVHPWELDPQQPHIPRISSISRFRHYTNLQHTEKRLVRLLKQFSWGSIRDVLREYGQHERQPPIHSPIVDKVGVAAGRAGRSKSRVT